MNKQTFNHLTYPSDIKEMLSGRLVVNTSKRLRAREILNYGFTRTVTQRNGIVMEHIISSTAQGEYAGGVIVNNRYFFADDEQTHALPVELFFSKFDEIGAVPTIKINRETTPSATELRNFHLVPKDAVPKDYGKEGDGFWPFEGYEELGINCLADILANLHRFKFSKEREAMVLITDQHEIVRSLRRPYFEMLLAGLCKDDLMLVQLRSLMGILSRVIKSQMDERVSLCTRERQLLEQAALMPISSSTPEELDKTLNALVSAYESGFALLPDGSNVYDDPLFSFHF